MAPDSSLYRPVLSRAWQITRNHPALWLLGFFAALFGNGGEYEMIVRQFTALYSGAASAGTGMFLLADGGGANALSVIAGHMALRTGITSFWLGVLLGIAVLLVWLAIIAQGALIHAIKRAGSVRRMRIGESFLAARKRFWHLFGAIAISKGTALFLFAILGMPTAALLMAFMSPGMAFAVALFGLGMPLVVVFSFVAKYALAFVMLSGKDWKQAYAHALRLFAEHWLVSVEIALSLFAAVMLGLAVIVGIVLAAGAPFVVVGSGFFSLGWIGSANMVMRLARATLLLLVIIMGSALAVFQFAAWTELFLKIRDARHASKVVRVLSGWREKYK